MSDDLYHALLLAAVEARQQGNLANDELLEREIQRFVEWCRAEPSMALDAIRGSSEPSEHDLVLELAKARPQAFEYLIAALSDLASPPVRMNEPLRVMHAKPMTETDAIRRRFALQVGRSLHRLRETLAHGKDLVVSLQLAEDSTRREALLEELRHTRKSTSNEIYSLESTLVLFDVPPVLMKAYLEFAAPLVSWLQELLTSFVATDDLVFLLQQSEDPTHLELLLEKLLRVWSDAERDVGQIEAEPLWLDVAKAATIEGRAKKPA